MVLYFPLLTLRFKVLFMTNKHQDDLEHIRSMMERSSRFISLSGISGIMAGVIALIASVFAFYFMSKNGINYLADNRSYSPTLQNQLMITGMLALIGALYFGIFFTVRKSRKNNIKIWNALSQRLLISLIIPLIAGGIFCLALIYHGQFGLVAPATLIFYGLALINASKYTLNDIKYLGYCQLLLGLIALFFIGYGLFFWALGFGLLHIIYGFMMHKKYH